MLSIVLQESLQMSDSEKIISFLANVCLLGLSCPERQTWHTDSRRMVHIWLNGMPFNNRCLLSGSHLGLFPFNEGLRGEMKDLEVTLDSVSFFIKSAAPGFVHVYQDSSPSAGVLTHL